MTCATEAIEVGFVTDIEGNLDYFRKYVGLSKVLKYADDDTLELTSTSAHFVFGGDLFDKGDGDLRLSEQLVSLKRRYPERVVLLMGNLCEPAAPSRGWS